jgi:hypothetical protein
MRKKKHIEESLVVFLPTSPELLTPEGRHFTNNLLKFDKGSTSFKIVSDKEWLEMGGQPVKKGNNRGEKCHTAD